MVEQVFESLDEISPYRSITPTYRPDCECSSCLSRDIEGLSFLQTRDIEERAREYSGLLD